MPTGSGKTTVMGMLIAWSVLNKVQHRQDKRFSDEVSIRIDSRLLEQAESRNNGESRTDDAERLRDLLAPVGKTGAPGEQIRCVVNVGMLSEGWDAMTVTHILGLRALLAAALRAGRGSLLSVPRPHPTARAPGYPTIFEFNLHDF